MINNIEKLMQKNLISENLTLSKMIEDIVPITKPDYTNIELDADKKETFSMVVFKKQNTLTKIIKNFLIGFEKIKIIMALRDFKIEKKEEQQKC